MKVRSEAMGFVIIYCIGLLFALSFCAAGKDDRVSYDYIKKDDESRSYSKEYFRKQ